MNQLPKETVDKIAAAFAEGLSLRKTALRCGVNRESVLRYFQRFRDGWEPVEIDEKHGIRIAPKGKYRVVYEFGDNEWVFGDFEELREATRHVMRGPGKFTKTLYKDDGTWGASSTPRNRGLGE